MKKNCRSAPAPSTVLTLGILASSLVWAIAPQRANAAAIGLGGNNPLTYSQDFDSLAKSGTSSTLPSGWAISGSGYTANDGTSSTGGFYSYGNGNGQDRALGSLANGTGELYLGAQFQNTSGLGNLILDLRYRGEQWRRGGSGSANTLFFEVSTDATSLTTGTWSSVNALNFTSPNTSGNANDLNGNNNSTQLSSSFLLSVANNASFWIRWRDPNNPNGNDDGLAIDDFNLTVAAVPTPALLPGLVGFTIGVWRKRRKLAAVD